MVELPENIIISRTDGIGDVVLTLPMVSAIKAACPTMKVAFLGRSYSKELILSCSQVDQFLDINDFLNQDILIDGHAPRCIIHVFPVKSIAKRARDLGIPIRIGTSHRFYHWWLCNKLLNLGRKKSNLHESQLNLKLLSAFKLKTEYSLSEIARMYALRTRYPIDSTIARQMIPEKYHLIIHPGSKGSAREWGLDNFIALIHMIDERFQVFITGTMAEADYMAPLLREIPPGTVNMVGKLPAEQLIPFINACDGLVANSTGPLHIAAALGKDAVGIYPPCHPVHPGRWAPIGTSAHYFVKNVDCNDCRKGDLCHCIREITPQVVMHYLSDCAQRYV